MLFEVFPPQMICIGKNIPSIVMLNIAVIVLLSADPATETLLIPLGASVLLQPGTYLFKFQISRLFRARSSLTFRQL